jgi:hypothetical protein
LLFTVFLAPKIGNLCWWAKSKSGRSSDRLRSFQEDMSEDMSVF